MNNEEAIQWNRTSTAVQYFATIPIIFSHHFDPLNCPERILFLPFFVISGTVNTGTHLQISTGTDTPQLHIVFFWFKKMK